jgi:hypothetical protein
MHAGACKGSTTGVSARTPLRIVGHWSEILHKMRVSDSTGEPGEVGEGPTFLSIADFPQSTLGLGLDLHNNILGALPALFSSTD